MKIWLIGAGPMATDYVKVLNGLNVDYDVIGRGENSAKRFHLATGIQPHIGGLENFLDNNPDRCTHAIVAVGVEALADSTKTLLNYGIKNILVEKPAGLYTTQIKEVAELARESNARAYVAYNRRFYASVIEAQKIIEEDGGVTSFNFEFTEWAHKIEPLIKAPSVKENWFLANSSHVVDLAFYLGGKPKEISTFVGGELKWHPSGSIFSGAGVSETGALFSYQANWESAGRWSVEILTKDNRLYLCPLEELQIQRLGSVQKARVEGIDYSLDEKFKPGLYLQTRQYLNNEYRSMQSIEVQSDMCSLYDFIIQK